MSDWVYDVLIAGMGPAGIAAACVASETGARVGVIDDNPAEGGQIWRGGGKKPESGLAAEWIGRFRLAPLDRITGTQIVAAPEAGVLLADRNGLPLELRYRNLVLATGARERFLPFPGWTLPNVMGAGGLQALVKGGLPIRGKRVVVAGTGPLLLAVAAYLRKRGADIALIAEQADLGTLARFGLASAREPSKVSQALAFGWTLRGVPYRAGCWPIGAQGDGRLASVVFKTRDETWTETCDYLACGFGLVPNLELPLLLGCAVANGFVAVDEQQRTSLGGVYCAGELVGIGGVDVAVLEGRIAGLGAAGRPDEAKGLFPARSRALWIRPALAHAFALRDELRMLPSPDTIVCRCEDVTYSRIAGCASSREAKLQTRCGMGPCQGRVCGPALEFLLGWPPPAVRPPVFPVRLDHIAQVHR